MGTFTHPIALYSDDRSVAETVDALVDTGATFLAMPGALLDRLGVEPFQSVTLGLANGEVEQRRIGEVRVELDGQDCRVRVRGAVRATHNRRRCTSVLPYRRGNRGAPPRAGRGPLVVTIA